ncbi:Beta-hexosaminidase [Acidisarcina polymorpha]|uniref:beta-N-acetylhexosaminidase n=1 Tax=Acidisarcina polymorpha TaxID=2211140 RepID=A0A2Z5FV95_9BACT|nr:Beta-hexosaminidase [Acidisarcina polymorpha]
MVMLISISVCAAAPVQLDHKGERWAAATLRKMSLEEKIGQLIMPWARIEFMNVNSPDYLLLQDEMRKYHVGGFGVTVFTDGGALLKSEPLEAAALTNGLQQESKYPLLFAADFERGLAMRLNGATSFPAAMAFGAAADVGLARELGRITAEESRAIGVQWNWFPVADVNSNPANPIINTRSFGEDPEQVGAMVSAYIAGARGAGMLTTVKHFPGHGDTDTDSHLTLARANASLDRLNSVELVPFRAAIAAGVDSVMIAHITVPSIEPDPNRPASISSNVVTELLKQKLGFQGLVVTDALDMGALTRVFPGTPAQVSAAEAVQAIQAGNDMVIIPADLDGAYNGLLDAVRNGTITQKRIDESVLKILRLKASVGLERNRLVDIAAVRKQVGRPENIAIAQTVADRAVTLVSDANRLVPLRTASGVVAVIFSDEAQGSEGARTFARQLLQRVPDATVFYVDSTNSGFVADDVLAAAHKATAVIALAEAVPRARRTTNGQSAGSVGLDRSAAELLASIVKDAGNKTIVAAFGNPYIGVGVPGIGTYICTFSNVPASGVSLAAALFGEIPMRGRLPISLPGIAKRGTQ